MKLAHLIMAHNAPAHLFRLVERLQHPDAHIYIYIDAKANLKDFVDLQNRGNIVFIKKRISVSWCGYSTVKATLTALEQILETGTEYSHINFLSGLDYPLISAQEARQFFFANADKTFMTTRSVNSGWEDGLARTRKIYLGDYKFPGKHRIQNVINSFGVARKVPGNVGIYGGSQWFTITPEAARYVIDYMRGNKKLQRYFKNTFASDEIVFQTVLMASPLRSTLVNDNLRYIRMSPHTFRPETFSDNDEQVLLGSGKFYARKFDEKLSASLLNKLDEAVLSQQ